MDYLPWVMGPSLTLEGTGFSFTFPKPLHHQIEEKSLYVRHPYGQHFQELFSSLEFWYVVSFSYLLQTQNYVKTCAISIRFLENFTLDTQISFCVSMALEVQKKLQRPELLTYLGFLTFYQPPIAVYLWILWLITLLKASANSLPILSQGLCVSPQAVLS